MTWACLLSATAAAQQTAQLSGSVHEATGGPLAGVTVSIQGPETRAVESGADGRFTFENLADGEYELTAELPQFAPARRTLSLAPGETVTLSLTLSVLVLEQAIVTAAKIGARDLQDTPMAVSMLTGSDLRRGQTDTVARLAGLAPSVTFSQNSDYAQLSIRGIGSNVTFAGSDPSAAVYIDGVYIARPVMVLTDFLDLERVEVLRGPQGTLYGRNAIGGALNVITRAPTNDVEASARLVAGTRGTFRTEARVSGPVVRSRVMASAAFLRGVARGFVSDLEHPDEPLGSEDVTSVQGKLQFVLPRRSSLLVSTDLTHKDPTPLTYAKVLAVKPGFAVDNPADLHEVRTSTFSANRTREYGAAARFTTRLGETTLTSLTAFRKMDFDNWNDADITELELAAGHVREIQHQWSEEITLAQRRSRVNWVAGLFFFDEVDRQPVSVRLGGPRLENRFEATVDADASAAFGQATIALTDRLSTTAGLRYSRERKSIASDGALSTLEPPITVLPSSVYAFTDAISHTAWTPRVGLEVRARESLLAYISATRGFKSGGFNLTSPEAGRGYAPEWAWSYEAGVKTALASGRARLNAAVFETDYSDLQVQTAIRPGIIDISNAAEATIRGVEVEGVMRVTRALEAGGHLAWLDATYDRYVAVGVGGVTGDAAGHRLNNAPEWSGRLWLEWTNEVGRAALLSMRADARWQSTVFFTAFNDAIQRQRPYGLVDVSAEIGPRHRRWFVEAYARNLTNEDIITGTFSSPPPAIGGRPGEPRQTGVQLTLQGPAR